MYDNVWHGILLASCTVLAPFCCLDKAPVCSLKWRLHCTFSSLLCLEGLLYFSALLPSVIIEYIHNRYKLGYKLGWPYAWPLIFHPWYYFWYKGFFVARIITIFFWYLLTSIFHVILENQQKTIYSLNAALSKLVFLHISNAHYYFLFRSKLDTKNMVKTSDYLYLNKEINFIKPLKMFVPGAELIIYPSEYET